MDGSNPNATPIAIIVAIIAWVGSVWVAHINGKAQRQVTDANNDATLEQHTDKLAIQMLEAANRQIERLELKLTKLQPLEEHFYYLQQCIQHCKNLLNCETAERPMIERAARAFIARIERLTEAEGVLKNEMQRTASSISLAGRLASGLPITPLGFPGEDADPARDEE